MNAEEAQRMGAWIVRAREAREWSQQDLAAETGLSTSRLSDIERGKVGSRGWNKPTLRVLEMALGAEHGDLLRVARGEDVPIPAAGYGAEIDAEDLVRVAELLGEQVAELRRRLRARGL